MSWPQFPILTSSRLIPPSFVRTANVSEREMLDLNLGKEKTKTKKSKQEGGLGLKEEGM
jgi:hypothetical protein